MTLAVASHMAHRTALAVLIAALAGCSPSRDNRFRADVPADDMPALRSAAAEWCERSDGEFCATFDGGDNAIRFVAFDPNNPQIRGTNRRSWDGETTITIVDCSDYIGWPEQLFRIVRHELGHHFAYNDATSHHLPAPNVMVDKIERQGESITDADLAEIRR